MTDDDTRSQGIEFGELNHDLEGLEYPIDINELVDKFGDHKIDLADGSQPLQEVLAGFQDREFESPDDVRQAVKNMVGSKAVGRDRYSDRGTGARIDESAEDDSF